MNSEIQNLKQVLRDNGFSLTRARRQVFDALSDSDTLDMSQLMRKLHSKVNRSSVYRTIDLFEKHGIVNRLQIGWKYKLELSEAFSSHHHHATCLNCNKIIAFEEGAILQDDINNLADELGLRLASHSLELRGTCRNCQKADS